jgi:serine/threonine-protein kinase
VSATLELLASLTQYAEAGAVQPAMLQQAAVHALEQHGDHVEVLLAVGKLYLASGDRNEAGRILGRASRVAPDDRRLAQLLVDAGIESPRRVPTTPRTGAPLPGSGPRSVQEERRAAQEERRAAQEERRPLSSEELTPSSTREIRASDPPRDSTLRSLRSLAIELEEGDETVEKRRAKVTEAPPPTPRSSPADGPLLRPTVRMARVPASPDRSRWGKSEGREPFDSRPDRETPSSEAPRTSSEGPRSVRSRGDVVTPGPASIRFASRDAQQPTPARGVMPTPRSSRAATGNLKLLDPNDERRHLDRYELIGEIASGGMASVYLARLAGVAGFQRFFAVKRLHPHLADEQEFIDMFLDEARLAAGIHHPNVVPILEVGTTDAGYYLVMDYIEGDTLSGVMNRGITSGGIPRPVALRIVLDALHGLHAAHELTDGDDNPLDLVHRDCSPQNILVGIDGSSRITDFGVARASSRLSTTRSATVKGKLAYLSPEQATGRSLDRRSDLFGMGVILWEVLAGRRLFRADTDGATLSRILVEPIPSLLDYVDDLPENVAAAVAIALARDPHDRYNDAAEMADAIEHAVREAQNPDLFVASPREVAAYMRELFGADIHARREAIRAWSAQSDGSAISGPRSQGARRSLASPEPPSSQHSGERAVASSRDSEPVSSGGAPVSSGGDVPSSKTEPSASSVIDRPAPSAAESKPAAPASEAAPKPDAPASEAAPSDATVPAADSPIRAASAAVTKQERKKDLPIPLLVFAMVLGLLALAAYIAQARAKKPAGGPPPSPPAVTAAP